MKTIFIIEDEDIVSVVYQQYCKLLGYKVLVAASAEEALKFLSYPRFVCDLIITDWKLPKLCCREFIEMLKNIVPDTPLLVISGQIREEVASDAGVAHFMLKPFTLEELEAKITELIGENNDTSRA